MPPVNDALTTFSTQHNVKTQWGRYALQVINRTESKKQTSSVNTMSRVIYSPLVVKWLGNVMFTFVFSFSKSHLFFWVLTTYFSSMWNKPKQSQLSPKYKSPTLVKTHFTPPHSPTKEKERNILRSKTPGMTIFLNIVENQFLRVSFNKLILF